MAFKFERNMKLSKIIFPVNCIHIFSKSLFNNYCVPGFMPNKDTVVNMLRFLSSRSLYLVRKQAGSTGSNRRVQHT